MIADILLVKFKADNTTIDDVIICESKLSAGTDYTKRQKQGWRLIHEGKALEVKAPSNSVLVDNNNPPIGLIDGGVTLPSKNLLQITASKTIRISDSGNKNGGFTNQAIPVSNYSTYQAKN